MNLAIWKMIDCLLWRWVVFGARKKTVKYRMRYTDYLVILKKLKKKGLGLVTAFYIDRDNYKKNC